VSDRYEAWRVAMLKSEGKGLLELHRNYLGDVSMPYRKHDVVGAIERFARKSAVQAALGRLLDRKERSLLGALAVAGPLGAAEAGAIAGVDPSEAADTLDNLVDRLAAYPTGTKPERWALCPWLPDSYCAESPFELSFASADEERSGACDDATALAALATLLREPKALKRDLMPGARGEAAFAQFAPEMLAAQAFPGFRARAFARAFQAARLASFDDRGCAVDPAFLRDYASCLGALPGGRGLLIFLASLYLALRLDEDRAADSPLPDPVALRDSVSRIAGLFRVTLSWLAAARGPDGAYARCPHRGLATLIRALAIGAACGAEKAADKVGAALPAGEAERFADAALAFGFLERVGGGKGEPLYAAPLPQGDEPASEARIDGSGTVFAPPGLPLAGLAALVAFGRIEARDAVWTFRLGRETAARAFASGMPSAAIREWLERLSRTAIPQSLDFMIREWEVEFSSVRFHSGVVVSVGPERRQAFAAFAKTLGDESLPRLNEGAWIVTDSEGLEAIVQAGFAPRSAAHDALAAFARRDADEEGAALLASAAACARALSDAPSAAVPVGLEPGSPGHGRPFGSPPFEPAAAERALAEIGAAIDGLDADARIKREYRDRLRRKLIASVEQLRAMRVSVEGGEAKGLDFMAKVRLVERAVESGGTLEVAIAGPDGRASDFMLRPASLSRVEGDVLVRGVDLSDGAEKAVHVGSIAALRRVRMNVFGAK
jgi:hypothetical protein